MGFCMNMYHPDDEDIFMDESLDSTKCLYWGSNGRDLHDCIISHYATKVDDCMYYIYKDGLVGILNDILASVMNINSVAIDCYHEYNRLDDVESMKSDRLMAEYFAIGRQFHRGLLRDVREEKSILSIFDTDWENEAELTKKLITGILGFLSRIKDDGYVIYRAG